VQTVDAAAVFPGIFAAAGESIEWRSLIEPQAKLKTFEALMLPHLDAAHNLARWLARSAPDAEDIVQESYLRAFRFFEGYHGGDSRSWLLTVVRNTFLTWRKREQRSLSNVPLDEERHGVAPAAAAKDSEGEAEALRGCIEALPPEFREVLILREFEELPYREIAEIASLPAGTVMSRLSRARQRLEDCVRKKVAAR
jgi:RNA polymerase sigma factor (sigma-70 family)